ncbi:Protein CBR-DOD-23 [Caenorhabditis briggsae]|uniref:Uncharacterized protein n=3 Tax=Caenorhabditis briggsae TaxID=6238 RepID=A0AAE9J5G4_CAEBR|nr:Protein CBR-DOD-23 [Caenorhabditis briggsae]ULU04469.1 hypothetical protein L3Y34_017322 [Caenorhabditis briggsae]UMM16466.1 hypothetical protein L5515_013466 [Caenorhabditis briggsae]CAP21989.1 Protein CBR-DOD-23 [Caenorhabditis briggsae]
MSLIGKIALVVVVILAIQYAEASVHHRHHKNGDRYDDRIILRSGENAPNYHLHGHITCNGNGVRYARPYLHSPLFPKLIINLYATGADGEYRLSTGTIYDLRGSLELMVRHTCRIEGLPPSSNCAVPYYTTNIPIDISSGKIMMEKEIELFDMKQYSTADCLY